jgi:glucosyl-dolichyl phosphate glucuronosyltransferase
MSATVISSIVCTRNNPRFLRNAVRSLLNQTLRPDEYEILIVDNASTGETGRMVREEFGEAGPLRYISEPRIGLPIARNSGIRHARGRYVAFIDDDATASEDWLENIVSVFETIKPQPGAVGGRIVLSRTDFTLPSWFKTKWLGDLTQLDYDFDHGFLSEGQLLTGTNFAARKECLVAASGFAENMPPNYNDERLIQKKLSARGYPIYYDRRILVTHAFHEERMTEGWLAQRHYAQGCADAALWINLRERSRVAIFLCCLRRYLGSFLKYLFHLESRQGFAFQAAYARGCRCVLKDHRKYEPDGQAPPSVFLTDPGSGR